MSRKDERLAKAEALFHEALELPPERRESFLQAACGDDAELLREVTALLRASGIADEWLSDADCAAGAPREGERRRESEGPGTFIGRYKLLQKIGEGGMGVVYMAEQREPVIRKVALKIIKLGMDTRQVIARFAAERQALAMMDHPHIAQVLDAGATETGRPYFVMDLVHGVPITEFCAANELSVEDRIRLFIPVCHAIQSAHQKGIIHRDIKPSNVLVTRNNPGEPGHPMVIDFGVAKAIDQKLTEWTLFTNFGTVIGTPAYMSPEQAEMSKLDVDTRSDIYSLGVLLYELLTGTTPFPEERLRSVPYGEMQRIIAEEEPERPSTRLSKTLRAKSRIQSPKSKIDSDLDWIVMKCLEKDRNRRYETANGLAADIQRYLANEPVIARPPSRLYRFQKLARRNKLAFTAAGAILLSLVGGLVISTWSLVREKQALQRALAAERAAERARANESTLRQQAQTEATRSHQVAQFLKEMLEGVQPSVALGRDTKMLREILERTAKRLEDLREQPAVEADLRATLGIVYRDLGAYTNAEAMLLKALELQKKLHGEEHADVAKSLHELAETLRLQVRNAEAEARFREALALRRKLFGEENLEVASSLYGLAEVLRRGGPARVKAENPYRQALAIQRKLLPSDHLDVAKTLTGLGVLLKDLRGRRGEAELYLRQALDVQRKLQGAESPDVAFTLVNLSRAIYQGGGRAEGERMLREALAMQKKLLGDHRDTVGSLSMLANSVSDPVEAEALFREQLEMARKALGDHPAVAESLEDLAGFLLRQGRVNEAEPLAHECLAIRERTLPGEWRVFSARSLLGSVLLAQKKHDEAEPFLLSGYDGLKQHQDKIAAYRVWWLKRAHENLVQLYEAWGKPDQAAQWRAKLQSAGESTQP